MRHAPWTHLDPFRVLTGRHASPLGADYGAFTLLLRQPLVVIASAGDAHVPWEHVSVSLKNRPPNWSEMCAVKDLFWQDEEAVAQFHPPRSLYVNHHPYCLHMWRPTSIPLVLPPSWTVGPRDGQTTTDMNAEIERAHGWRA